MMCGGHRIKYVSMYFYNLFWCRYHFITEYILV